MGEFWNSAAFSTYIFPFVLAFLSTIAGAWLSIKWPIWRDNNAYKKEAKLLGDWHSCWADPQDSSQWIQERVLVSVGAGSIKLKSSENSGGYEWEGSGELYDRRFFYGTWKSTKDGSHSTGVFSFFLLPQGNCAVGFGFGPSLEGAVTRFDWAMGKTPESLDFAKEWIAKSKRKVRRKIEPPTEQ